MRYQNLFSEKIKRNIFDFSPAEFAYGEVKVKIMRLPNIV